MDLRPFVMLSIDGRSIADQAYSRLSSVRVTDTAGFLSDTAEITFDNADPSNLIAMPEPGAVIGARLGYRSRFVDVGIFIADEIEEMDPPRTITLVCRARSPGQTSDGLQPVNQQKSRSWAAGLTIQSIAGQIAAENGLQSAVTEAAGAIIPGHVDQLDESDIGFITRLSLAHDLVAKPTAGRLFLGLRSEAVTVSGQDMPTRALQRSEVSSWTMRRNLGPSAAQVVATYRDMATAKDVEVSIGEGVPVRRLRHRFANEAEARSAANVESRRAGRAVETLQVSMAGDPTIATETMVIPADFSSAARGAWVLETVVHEIGSSGFSTSFSAIRPAEGNRQRE